MTEVMNCYLHVILVTLHFNLKKHMQLVAIELDSKQVDFFFSSLPIRKLKHRLAVSFCQRSESWSLAESRLKPWQSDSGARTFNSNTSMGDPEGVSQSTELYLKALPYFAAYNAHPHFWPKVSGKTFFHFNYILIYLFIFR